MEEDIFDFIEETQVEINEQQPATTLEELKQLLSRTGEQWKEEHATEKQNKETGAIEKIIPRIPPRKVADILSKECQFILIDEDNPELAPLAVYDLDNGIYQKGERFINRLSMSVERSLTLQQCNTIQHYLTTESEEKQRTTDKNLIVANNGIYNRVTQRLEPFSSEYVFVNKIATDYIENATEPYFKDWNFSNWIKELSDGNASKEKLLWQLFAVAINANYVSEIAVFFLSEDGKTGKSTFQRLISNLVGSSNTSSLKIKEFESDFKLASAYGKSLVIGDDNNPKDFNETSENFKSVVTGDNVLLNPKGREPFSTTLTPFVIQSMNGLPRFRDISDGLQRRLRIIRFNHVYKGDKNNREIKEKYIYDKRLLQFILYHAINMEFVEVEDTAESKEAVYELVLENNSVLSFFEDKFQELESERLPMKFLFKFFQAYCDYENQPTGMKQNSFSKEMKGVAERNGWKYQRNNLAPLHFFYQSDIQRLAELDIHYKYRYDVVTNKKQPILERQQSNKRQQSEK